MAPKPITSNTPTAASVGTPSVSAAVPKVSKPKECVGTASSSTATTSATAPISSRPSMNNTGRPACGASFSLRIITAPPKPMISQAMRKPAPSRTPNTPKAPIRLMAAPNSQPALPCGDGVASAQASAAGASPNPNSHSASGLTRKCTRSPASIVGRTIAPVASGRASNAATMPTAQPRNSSPRATSNPRPVSAKKAAASQASNATVRRSFGKLASFYSLRGALEEHQQRLNNRRRIRRAAGQVNIDWQHAVEPMAAGIAAFRDAA